MTVRLSFPNVFSASHTNDSAEVALTVSVLMTPPRIGVSLDNPFRSLQGNRQDRDTQTKTHSAPTHTQHTHTLSTHTHIQHTHTHTHHTHTHSAHIYMHKHAHTHSAQTDSV